MTLVVCTLKALLWRLTRLIWNHQNIFLFDLEKFEISGDFPNENCFFWKLFFQKNYYNSVLWFCLSRRAIRGGEGGEREEGGGRPPLPYFENRKKVPWFCKKCPDCVHLWVKFSIQNVILRMFRRKNSQIFPCVAFFSSVFDRMFIKVS